MRNIVFRSQESQPRNRILARSLAAALMLVSIPLAVAQRTHLKPGMNIYTPQQDIEIGRETSKQAEQQLALLNNAKVDDYLTRLGKKLAAKAPGEKYPYQFKGVNDTSINAFALPGGFLYINRGTIEAADNEAQLAGVIGHEIGHAALRHGTNQMTKAAGAQTIVELLGGLIGQNSITGQLTKLGANFGAESILLKYSRDAERQADIVGTQILYDNGYDPRNMALFFQKLEAETSKTGRPIQFFSSHPNPENRIVAVDEEVAKMGGASGNYVNDSPEFHDIQKYVRTLPPPPKTPPRQQGTAKKAADTGPAKPAPPSGQFLNYEGSTLKVRYPDNWKPGGDANSVTFAPEGGYITAANGNSSLAYGVIASVFELPTGAGGQANLQSATTQLIDSLRESNTGLRKVGESNSIRVDGQAGLATTLSNVSPAGGNETDWLITVVRPEGLVFFVFVAPEADFASYRRTYQDMVNSIRWK